MSLETRKASGDPSGFLIKKKKKLTVKMGLDTSKIQKIESVFSKDRRLSIKNLIVPVKKVPIQSTSILTTSETETALIPAPEQTKEELDLPGVSIITLTHNRKKFFPLIYNNFRNFKYPSHLLEWIIVDDTTDEKEDVSKLIPPNQNNIEFIHLDEKTSIGKKRNIGVERAKYDFIVNMDDDDYHYPDSILNKICCMLQYNKNCIYSESIGVYDIMNQNSFIVEGYRDVPESTMAFRKSFWEKEKFEDSYFTESAKMVQGREDEMLCLPYFFNVILLTHKSNITGRHRSMRFSNDGGRIKKISSVQSSINFYKLAFDEMTQKIVKMIEKDLGSF